MTPSEYAQRDEAISSYLTWLTDANRRAGEVPVAGEPKPAPHSWRQKKVTNELTSLGINL